MAQLESGGEIKRSAVVIAASFRYMELAGTAGYDYQIEDKMAAVLHKNAVASAGKDPLSFLKKGLGILW